MEVICWPPIEIIPSAIRPLTRTASTHQLVTATDAANCLFAIHLGSASRPEKEPVDFTLRDAVMSSGRLEAAALLLVDPLLDRGKADPQSQSRVTELQHLSVFLSGFAVPQHRRKIVGVTAFRSRVSATRIRIDRLDLYIHQHHNCISHILPVFLGSIGGVEGST
jgi:hypothetical protein